MATVGSRTGLYIAGAALATVCALGLYALLSRGPDPRASIAQDLAVIQIASATELSSLTADLHRPMLDVILPTALAHDGWLLREAANRATREAIAAAEAPTAVAAILTTEYRAVEDYLSGLRSLNIDAQAMAEALAILDASHAAYRNHLAQTYAAQANHLTAIAEFATNLFSVVGYFEVNGDRLVFEQPNLQFTYENNIHALGAEAADLARYAAYLDGLDSQHAEYPTKIAELAAGWR